MENLSLTACEILDCGVPASRAAVVGTQFFCIEPSLDGAAVPASLLRLNLCEGHISDVRRVFTEIKHDPELVDFRDVAIFA